MKRIAFLFFCLIAPFYVVYNQPDIKDVIKAQSRVAGDIGNAVEGFHHKLSGEDILYQSTREDCQNALLVRATDGKMSISWETPVLNFDLKEKEYQLFLIAGMSLQGYSTEGVDPGFRVYINDRFYFHFKNSMGENWTTTGPDGSRMIFQTILKDQAKDGFGYARIVLPSSSIENRKPISIRIEGDSTGTRHWFMVFQCPDALDWFRKKAMIDSWLEVRISEITGKYSLKIDATETWNGQALELIVNSGNPQRTILPQKGFGTLSGFIMPLELNAIGIKLPGGEVIPDIRLEKTYSKSIIQPDRLISYQVKRVNEKQWLLQTQISTSSIQNDLDNLSGSQLSRGKIHIIASSHQDIAWMDSPQACVENRDNLLITPALKKLEENQGYFNDMEDILMLKEYLVRHPDKKGMIYNLTKEGRLTCGASFIQPYEEMYFGESLIRQFYLGKKWFEKEFPGCDARIYWNVDVPGRTLQMPQILAKSGVDYMIISRQDKGLFNWKAPDGSKILTYSPGHYYDSYINLKKGFFESVGHFSNLADFWDKYYSNSTQNPVMPVLSDADMAVPDSYFDYIDTWNSLKDSTLILPQLFHSTAARFLDEAVATGAAFPVIQGERPAVWLYIHGPSHFEALKAGRSAGCLLPAAEKMASIRSVLENDWDLYPTVELSKAWESAIYPDHGWGGKNGEITDSTFLAKFREADQTAKSIIEEATKDIAGNINFTQKGIPLVIFNSLAWDRTDPVEIELNFPDKSYRSINLLDAVGGPVSFQVSGRGKYYTSGFLKSIKIAFIAENIPSLGFQTYYVNTGKKLVDTSCSAPCLDTIETRNYKIKFGKGGIESLVDKDLGKEVFTTDQFKGGDLFSMHSFGNGAGEFSDIQQPDMEGFEKAAIGPEWTITESGPVKVVVTGTAKMNHNKATVTWTIYRTLKRIDVKTDLLDWDGTAYREFRLAFPARMQNPEITYEVPFGVVRVGKDELAQAAGERYKTLCKDVHPRGINNWISASDNDLGLTISSSVAVWDYVNMTNLPTTATVLQPILLASRQSCHGEGPLYHQKGSHTMEFSLFTHQPGWQNGYHNALQANEKLTAVFNPPVKTANIPSRFSFLSVDHPDLIVSTIKKSDDDNSLIVRVYDQEGREKQVNINLYIKPFSAESTNLIEENGKIIPINENGIRANIGHNAIETFKFRFR